MKDNEGELFCFPYDFGAYPLTFFLASETYVEVTQTLIC